MARALRHILVVYVILALAVFAFPGGLVEWLDNHNDSGWLSAPLSAMRVVDAASASVGVKAVGQSLRKRFGAAFSGDEDQ